MEIHARNEYNRIYNMPSEEYAARYNIDAQNLPSASVISSFTFEQNKCKSTLKPESSILLNALF